MTWQVVNGDNIAWLQALPDGCVDAIVCDPPYGLSAEPDMRQVLTHWLAGDDYQHRGGGFMGRSWDSFVPGPSTWRECLRVLRPGGHMLAFGGTRTYDLLVTAVRLAGFEIRDTIAWLYGAGFPKSLDVSKAIDRVAGVEREIVATGAPAKRMTPGADQEATGSWIKDDGREYLPTVTRPATAEASRWEGWGTALKPAHEPIVVARKPLVSTVAANVIAHGTGALNIDACRVDAGGDSLGGGAEKVTTREQKGNDGWASPWMDDEEAREAHAARVRANVTRAEALGRWPANVALDPDAAVALDAQTGELRSGDGNIIRESSADHGGNRSSAFGAESRKAGEVMVSYGDRGGASRFFYCAKTAPEEREAGLDGLPVTDAPTTTSPTSTLQHGRTGSRRVDERIPERAARANDHPTVKPIELMRWLIRLVTPPGGVVLDPFCGSGSTGCAAVLEGADFLGVDLDEHYCDIAIARIGWWARQDARPAEHTVRAAARARADHAARTDHGQLAMEAL